jgi:hypothetical protein
LMYCIIFSFGSFREVCLHPSALVNQIFNCIRGKIKRVGARITLARD